MRASNVYWHITALALGISTGVMLGAQLRVISVYAAPSVWCVALLIVVWAGVQAYREDRL